MKKAMAITAGVLMFTAVSAGRADELALSTLGPSRPMASAPVLPGRIITDLTNAPNPFDSRHSGLSGETEISYTLDSNHPVSITLYDLFGMKVRSWDFHAGENGGRSGVNSVLWNGANEDGRKVSKGGYIAEIEIETPQTTVTAIRKIGVIH